MTAEFNWWLLIVGLVVGAGLVWLVLADSSRRDQEIGEQELPVEAAWIAASLRERGRPMEPEAAEEVLRLHRTYLGSLPPDGVEEGTPDEAPARPEAPLPPADETSPPPAGAAPRATPSRRRPDPVGQPDAAEPGR